MLPQYTVARLQKGSGPYCAKTSSRVAMKQVCPPRFQEREGGGRRNQQASTNSRAAPRFGLHPKQGITSRVVVVVERHFRYVAVDSLMT